MLLIETLSRFTKRFPNLAGKKSVFAMENANDK